MSGECDSCGNHTLECLCRQSCNKWIDAKIMLPLHPGRYLIFVKGNAPEVYIDGFGEVSEGFYGFVHDKLFGPEVTHWTPLPDGPKTD